MNVNRLVFALVPLLASLAWTQQYQYPFQDPSLPIEARVDNILLLMSAEEKISALSTTPDVPRLGIRGSGHIEGLHGVAYGGPGGWEGRGLKPLPTTQFPQSAGLGETWDPDLLQKAAAIEGYEARYIFQSEDLRTTNSRGEQHRREGIVVRAPNADLARDPRWGRSEESYGEDPYLTGTMTVAFIRGLQGDDPHYWLTASLMKHFLANSNEDGRGGSSSDFDERLLREYYSVPFRMGVMDGGSRAYMTAYNAYNGIPMAAQPVLRDLTIEEWGFDGIICTDAGALTNMVTQHKYFPEINQATAGAIHAGINQFLDRYREAASAALEKKFVNLSEIDENLRGRVSRNDPAWFARSTGRCPLFQNQGNDSRLGPRRAQSPRP
jgi:beta-glucosidase